MLNLYQEVKKKKYRAIEDNEYETIANIFF